MRISLATALEKHQAGELGLASQLYENVLAGAPKNPEALHLLGVLRHQQGDHRQSLELINRALVERPDVAAFHINLAEAYRALGQFELAIGCCLTALGLGPEHAETHNNLGLALQELQRHTEAIDHFRRALELKPEFASAHSNLGISLRELNRVDEGLPHFLRAVELDPTSATAQTNLGQFLIDSGRTEEALAHCLQAVRIQPVLAPLHHNLGNAFRALKRFAEARSAYLEAVRLDPNLALPAAHLGQILRKEGKLDEALIWLKRVTELEPQTASHWKKLGALYSAREEFSEAIICWERALHLEPGRADVHNRLGSLLQKEGRKEGAGEHYRSALRLRPKSAVSYLNIAGLHKEFGELAEAATACREALRVEPSNNTALASLAILLRGRLPEADLAVLEQRLSDPKLGESPRARLLFALAHVLDDRGEYNRAAVCLREANALSLALAHRLEKRPYEPKEYGCFVERLIQALQPEWFLRLAGAGSPTRRPVFVFGMPRSGTTLVEQILSSHRCIHGAGELRLARRTFDAIPDAMGRCEEPLCSLPHVDAATIRSLADRHDERLRLLAPNGTERVVDKMPENYIFLGLLETLFPQAVFIHCRRDLRDVALSCWQTDFGAIPRAHDPGHIAEQIRQYVRLMEHWRTVLPVPLLELDYEEVVSDLEGTTRRLLAACGQEWDPACLEFHRTVRPVRTASAIQVRRPIYTSSVHRWRNYALALDDLFAAVPPDTR